MLALSLHILINVSVCKGVGETLIYAVQRDMRARALSLLGGTAGETALSRAIGLHMRGWYIAFCALVYSSTQLYPLWCLVIMWRRGPYSAWVVRVQ